MGDIEDGGLSLVDILFVHQGPSLCFVSWFLSQFVTKLEMSGLDPVTFGPLILLPCQGTVYGIIPVDYKPTNSFSHFTLK